MYLGIVQQLYELDETFRVLATQFLRQAVETKIAFEKLCYNASRTELIILNFFLCQVKSLLSGKADLLLCKIFNSRQILYETDNIWST